MKDLGADKIVLSAMERRALDEQGYLLMTDLIDRVWLDQLREAFGEAASKCSAITRSAGRASVARSLHPRL
jgi:hypothetical protein